MKREQSKPNLGGSGIALSAALGSDWADAEPKTSSIARPVFGKGRPIKDSLLGILALLLAAAGSTGNTAVGPVGPEALAPGSTLDGGGSSHDGSQDSETDHFGEVGSL